MNVVEKKTGASASGLDRTADGSFVGWCWGTAHAAEHHERQHYDRKDAEYEGTVNCFIFRHWRKTTGRATVRLSTCACSLRAIML
jgi:hypothetical protein